MAARALSPPPGAPPGHPAPRRSGRDGVERLGKHRHSPNWHRWAFRNVDEVRWRRRALDFLKWRLTDRRARIPRRLIGGAPRVEPDRALLRQQGFEGITWLGHASVLVQLGGTNLLIDPLWGNPAGLPCRLVPDAMPLADLPPVHTVLVSHNHFDHLQMRTLRRLGDGVLHLVPLGVDALLRRRRRKRVVGLDWWSSYSVDGLRLTFVPAHHWSQRGLTRNRSLWGGWVIESARATVYFSGDTARMPVLGEIGRRFPRIDYALLSAGSYEPRWYMKHVHMNPAEAVDTFVELGAGTLIPVHWGTLRLGAEPPGEAPILLRKEFARRGLCADALRVLAIGETLPIASQL